MILLVLASIVFEKILYLHTVFWKIRKIISLFIILIILAIIFRIAIYETGIWVILLCYVSLFRVINLLRIIKSRRHEIYLRKSTSKSSLILALATLAVLPSVSFNFHNVFIIYPLLSILQLLCAILFLATIIRNLLKTKIQDDTNYIQDKNLPTVTIAIPARNETPELTNCLISVTENNYPKLEVLVLDDCSHDRTPEIIRSFANRGVRFVKGSEPNENWLAKNHAYQKLSEEANGEIILFCDTNVRLGKDSVRKLVTVMQAKEKDMLCIIPGEVNNFGLRSLFLPMKYWSELALPRRFFNRPGTLNTCWLINRHKLLKLGSFSGVGRAMKPEGYLANEIIKYDGYSLLLAGSSLDIQTTESWSDSINSSIRNIYPENRKRPEIIMFRIALQIILFVIPLVTILQFKYQRLGTDIIFASLTILLLIISHTIILFVGNPKNIIFSFLSFPASIFIDIYLSMRSMLAYEFSNVIWKGRNVCIPMMHVTPSLPPAKTFLDTESN